MELVVTNLGGKVRRETLHGRDYYVAPLTMIVSGVLSGSQGALYYPPEEVHRNPDGWNGVPILLNHPTEGGLNVSGRSPKVWETNLLGHVFNATAKDGKLTAEGWFDVAATRRIDPGVLNALEQGRPLELSTGLFTENHPAPDGAAHNGKPYQFVARAYRADHLAILPAARGACSIADGCGVLVNEDKRALLRKIGRLLGITRNAKPSATADVTPQKACQILHDKSVNGHPLTDRQRRMFGAICGKQPTANVGEPGWECSVCNTGHAANAATKADGGEMLKASDYAYVPDPEKPSTWKLRIDDAAHVGAALAALGPGYRGQKADIPAADLADVKAKLRAAWLKFHPDKGKGDMPDVIRNEEGGAVDNSFCPTGEGGGVDPSCSPGGSKAPGHAPGADVTPPPKDASGRYSAAGLNAHLAKGGAVRTRTMTKATVYEKKHAGAFSEDEKGGLYVKHGKSKLFLGPAHQPYVAINVSRLPTANQADPFADSEGWTQTEGDTSMALTQEQRKAHADFIVTNCDCWKGAAMGKVLNDLPEDELLKVRAGVEKAGRALAVANAVGKTLGQEVLTVNADMMPAAMMERCKKLMAAEKMEPAANALPVAQPVTAEQWFAAAPPEVQSAVRNAVRVERQQKQAIVAKLVANRPQDQREARTAQLMKLDLEELQERLNDLPPVANDNPFAPNWSGAAAPIHNAADDSDNILPLYDLSARQEEPARKQA